MQLKSVPEDDTLLIDGQVNVKLVNVNLAGVRKACVKIQRTLNYMALLLVQS